MKKHFTIFPRDATPEQMAAQVDGMIAQADAASVAANEAAPNYNDSIQDKIDAAQAAAVTAATTPKQKQLIEDGHGTYVGTCGHVIQDCRCSQVPGKISVDAPCKNCASQ